MRLKCLAALFAIPVLAFEPPAKPTPREKARQLLDGVVETAAGAQPEVASAALLYVGQTYDLFDSKKAIEYLRQAFASTAAVPPGDDTRRASLQSRIASATAPLSLPDAVDMLKQIQVSTDSHGDPR